MFPNTNGFDFTIQGNALKSGIETITLCNVFMQFDWQFWITSSCFLSINILLQKIDTLSKKEMKMIKTQIYDEKQQKNVQKVDENIR